MWHTFAYIFSIKRIHGKRVFHAFYLPPSFFHSDALHIVRNYRRSLLTIRMQNAVKYNKQVLYSIERIYNLQSTRFLTRMTHNFLCEIFCERFHRNRHIDEIISNNRTTKCVCRLLPPKPIIHFTDKNNAN